MSDSQSEPTVAEIRDAISSAPEDERESVKAQYREAEIAKDDPRQGVLSITEPSEDAPDPGYTVEELTEGALARLGCSPHAVAGALSIDPERRWTVDQARQRIEEFMDTPAITAEVSE